MRKHFLLLFLLTLLPLAGFAAAEDYVSPNGVKFKEAANDAEFIKTDNVILKYTATEKALPIPAAIGNDPIQEYVVSKAWYKTTVDANGNVVKTGNALEKLEDAGKYICEFQVNQGNHQGNHTAIFEIAKCKLTVTASNLTNGANPGDPQNALTYGDAFTADNVTKTFTGWPAAIDTEAKKEELINSFGTITYTTDYVPFTSGVTDMTAQPVVYYQIVPIITGLVSNNYDFEAVHGKLQVVAKNMADGEFTVTTNNRFYNGQAEAPVLVVKDNANPDKALELTTDYTLAYYETAADAADGTNALQNAPIHVGNYWVTISGAATGNYTGTMAGVYSYKVRPQRLEIGLKEPTITYDAQAHDLTTLTLYDIEGLNALDNIASIAVVLQDGTPAKPDELADQMTTGTPSTAITSVTNVANHSNGYKIKSIVPTFANGSIAQAGDYSVVINTQFFKIEKAEIEIFFKNLTMHEDESGAIKAGIAITAQNQDTYLRISETKKPLGNDYIGVWQNVIAKQDNAGAWTINFVTDTKGNQQYPFVKKGTNPVVDVTKNYFFTLNPGTLTIIADLGILYVTPQAETYGALAKKGFIKVKVVGGTDAADNAKLEALLNNDKVTVKPYLNEQDPNDANNGKLLDVTNLIEYPNAGTYTVAYDESIYESADWLALKENYDINLTGRPTYTIKKAPLKIKLNNQSLNEGDDNDDLVADKYTVEFDGQVPGDAKDLYAAVQNKLILTGTVADDLYYDNGLQDDAIDYNQERVNATDEETTKGYFANAITLDANFTHPNYDVTIEQKGGLFVSANNVEFTLNLNPVTKAKWDELTDAVKANNSTKIAENGNHKVSTVKFDDFELKAEKWYPMVLPFNTTVAELSQKFGYAVVNILNTENTDDNIRFKLHMQDIKANQPFLIKIVEDKVMNDNTDPVEFTGVTILDSDYNADVNENTGIQFIGFYDAKIGVTDHDFWYHPTGGYDARYGGKADPNRYLRPLNAYVQTPAGSAAKVIYVEDPVQGVTAIESISAEGAEAIPVQGWYTINGIKLEGVPTEKGIYINNGKKVVIK